jgi:hypothetical protein
LQKVIELVNDDDRARPAAQCVIGAWRNDGGSVRTDGRKIDGRRGAASEILKDHFCVADAGAHAGLGIDADQLDAGGRAKRNGRMKVGTMT